MCIIVREREGERERFGGNFIMRNIMVYTPFT